MNGHRISPTDTQLTLRFSPGPSRCYPFWQEVLGCYVVNAGEGETGKKKCMPALEDYYECLHHKKEVRRSTRLEAGSYRVTYMIRPWIIDFNATGGTNDEDAGCIPQSGSNTPARERAQGRTGPQSGTTRERRRFRSYNVAVLISWVDGWSGLRCSCHNTTPAFIV